MRKMNQNSTNGLDRLWAPWRINYVSQKKIRGCVFCKIFKESKDEQNLVLSRSKHCFGILNTYPYNNGHLMIVSNRHIATLDQLTEKEILDMNKNVIKMTKILKQVLKAQGFNIGFNIGKVAGAGIEKHIHMHIVPRWLGDTNYMPVLSSTKIIAQSLEELYTQLVKALKKNYKRKII